MVAHIGNKNGLALKDEKIRQEAYKSYCAHLAKGKSKKSWYFEHEKLTCTWQTFEKYLKDPVEFNPIHKEIAEAKGFAEWEGICEESARGKNMRANTASLQMVMRNKFGWDKPSSNPTEEMSDEQQRYYEALMKQLNDLQEERKIAQSNINNE